MAYIIRITLGLVVWWFRLGRILICPELGTRPFGQLRISPSFNAKLQLILYLPIKFHVFDIIIFVICVVAGVVLELI